MKFLANKKVMIIAAVAATVISGGVAGFLWLRKRNANKPAEEVPANPEEK